MKKIPLFEKQSVNTPQRESASCFELFTCSHIYYVLFETYRFAPLIWMYYFSMHAQLLPVVVLVDIIVIIRTILNCDHIILFLPPNTENKL